MAAPGAAIRLDRRRALRIGLAGLGAAAAAVVLRPGRAGAFSLEPADAPTTAAFHNACGPGSYHQKLAEEVRTILVARHLPDAARPQTVVCPVCGCPVTV
jgi:hypothetical protein